MKDIINFFLIIQVLQKPKPLSTEIVVCKFRGVFSTLSNKFEMVFQKNSIIDIWQGLKYTSVAVYRIVVQKIFANSTGKLSWCSAVDLVDFEQVFLEYVGPVFW